MVTKEIILKSLTDAILKCGPTIKERFQSFNSKDYKGERYSKKDGQIKTDTPSPVGRMQKLQEDLQDNIDYSDEEKSLLWEYQGSGFLDYSAWFYHTSKWAEYVPPETLDFWYKDDFTRRFYEHKIKKYEESLDYWKYEVYNYKVNEYYDENESSPLARVMPYKTEYILDEPLSFKDYKIYDWSKKPPEIKSKLPFDKSIGVMDNLIDKSPPLQENTVLYRNGPFDLNLKVGETGKWKSYTSTSFNSYVARKGLSEDTQGELRWANSTRFQIKIYAPKGTKGVVPYDGNGCEDFQSEFLIGRNQKYIVLSVDKKKRRAEVLLY